MAIIKLGEGGKIQKKIFDLIFVVPKNGRQISCKDILVSFGFLHWECGLPMVRLQGVTQSRHMRSHEVRLVW